MVFATRFLLTVLLGYLSGFFSGAFGIGGASFSTPAIRLILMEPPGIALGTTLPLCFPSAAVGGFNYWRKGKVDARAVACAAPVGAACSAAGALLTSVADLHWLMVATAVMLLYLAARTLREARGGGDEVAEEPGGAAFAGWKLALVGAAAGLLSGLLGVGGGMIMVPGFLLWARMEAKRALGTSLVCVALLALPGTVVHAWLGHIDWTIFLAMCLGVLPGSWQGSRFTLRARKRLVFTLFAALLAATGIIFMVSELRIIF